MSRYDEILNQAAKLLQTHNTRNPELLAEYLNVTVLFRDFRKQKGMFTMVEGLPFVFVKSDLCVEIQNIIIAHELGDYLLHTDELGANEILFEENLFQKSANRQEFEANLFASEILLDTEEVLEYILQGATQEEMAMALSTDVNSVAMKVETLIKQGYDFGKLEYSRNFM